MDIRKQVGRNLKAIRLQRKLSQEQLAFECGMHRTYISGIERGVRNPSALVLSKIAKALNVEPHELLITDGK
ncbi:MAG TPA: XRE family transcriptional regulator [Rhodospirillales bacterium]|nr:XRE family transcriptional regulator [Rhodospirillales bacterium]